MGFLPGDPITVLTALAPSITKGVLELHEQLIRLELPALQELSDVVVVDDEQVADRAEGPPQPRVHAD
jgi:hypothetical protein